MHARARARRLALQALYQWQMTGLDIAEIETQFMLEANPRKIDTEYFRELLHQVPRQLERIDASLSGCVDRPLNEVDPVERSILRIAAYELLFRKDVPWRVVINEALELSKKFGAELGYKYINGVLDKLARAVRGEVVPAVHESDGR